MREIIIIGTLHRENTPHGELKNILEEINPDKILVELSPEELKNRHNRNSIRDEMFFSYDWAMENQKQVGVFDVENNFLKEGVTGKEEEFMIIENRTKELLVGYSWKDLNKSEPWENPELKH